MCLLVAIAGTNGGFARAQVDASVAGGAYRCASAFGSIPGGAAYLDVCATLGPAVTGTSTPGASATVARIQGRILLFTSNGQDDRTFVFDEADPSKPNPLGMTALTMDPTMSTATLTLRVVTISINVTFTADTLPDAYHWGVEGDSVSQRRDGNLDACWLGVAGAGVERWGTASGSVRSSTRGGGSFSGSSELRQGVGLGSSALASTTASVPCKLEI